MCIEELDKELTGRQLEIWNGTSGLSPEKEEKYRELWRKTSKTANTIRNNIVKNKRKGCGCKKKPNVDP